MVRTLLDMVHGARDNFRVFLIYFLLAVIAWNSSSDGERMLIGLVIAVYSIVKFVVWLRTDSKKNKSLNSPRLSSTQSDL